MSTPPCSYSSIQRLSAEDRFLEALRADDFDWPHIGYSEGSTTTRAGDCLSDGSASLCCFLRRVVFKPQFRFIQDSDGRRERWRFFDSGHKRWRRVVRLILSGLRSGTVRLQCCQQRSFTDSVLAHDSVHFQHLFVTR